MKAVACRGWPALASARAEHLEVESSLVKKIYGGAPLEAEQAQKQVLDANRALAGSACLFDA